jgi:hypothetical protein
MMTRPVDANDFFNLSQVGVLVIAPSRRTQMRHRQGSTAPPATALGSTRLNRQAALADSAGMAH